LKPNEGGIDPGGDGDDLGFRGPVGRGLALGKAGEGQGHQEAKRIRDPGQFEAGGLGAFGQLVGHIAPFVHQGQVVFAPEELVGWDGDHRMASGLEDPEDFPKRGGVILQMFEDIRGHDHIHGIVGQGQGLGSPARQFGQGPLPTGRQRLAGKIDAHDSSVFSQSRSGRARTTTDVDQDRLAVLRQVEAGDLIEDQLAAAYEPPIVILILEHPAVFVVEHLEGLGVRTKD
jgi:hypothetical protein